MPSITLPHASFSGVVDPDEVAENLHFPRATPDTFEVINGRLTETNLASSTITQGLVRKGHLSNGWQGGTTLNMDLFPSLFSGIEDLDALTTAATFNREARVVVGCSWFNPGSSQVYSFIRLHWNVGFIHDYGQDATPTDAERDDYYARARLFVDGQPVNAVTRDIREALHTLHNTATAWGEWDTGIPDTRWWSGSLTIDTRLIASTQWSSNGTNPLAPGWHSADIRVAAVSKRPTDFHAMQVRVRARRMGYVRLK